MQSRAEARGKDATEGSCEWLDLENRAAGFLVFAWLLCSLSFVRLRCLLWLSVEPGAHSSQITVKVLIARFELNLQHGDIAGAAARRDRTADEENARHSARRTRRATVAVSMHSRQHHRGMVGSRDWPRPFAHHRVEQQMTVVERHAPHVAETKLAVQTVATGAANQEIALQRRCHRVRGARISRVGTGGHIGRRGDCFDRRREVCCRTIRVGVLSERVGAEV